MTLLASLSRRTSPVFVIWALLLPAGTSAQEWGAPGSPEDLNRGREAPVAGGIVDLQRLEGPIVLDGHPTEAAWEGVEALPLTMYEPTFRGETDRRIWVKVAYDDEALYVSARFYHEDPDDIRAYSLTRDTWNGDDGFGVMLDTFNDNENAVRFIGLPLGARMDMSISGDGQEERSTAGPRGTSWNAFWDLRTEFLDDGWSGEMRVPFSSLRFQAGPDGSVVMGMMAYAYEPASEHRYTFPAIPRSALYTQVSAWQDVRIRGVEPRSPVYVSPYVLAGRQRTHELSPTLDRWEALRAHDEEIGLDVKLNPTPNLNLDLTINTDFAAVEADQQQINLNRFSLFFDEKRPFFQERAGIFEFGTGAHQGTLFYSRRIGLRDGEPVPILGGARLVGQIGGWDVGLIEMVTDEHAGLARENFGVVRLRKQVLNVNSYVGGMGTSRIDADGVYNHTYGLDGQFRLFGDEYLTVKWLQTFQGGTAALDTLATGFDASRVVVDWTRRRTEGLSYQNLFTWSGAGYDPGMGYESRRDFTRGQANWNYQWFPDEASRFRRVWLGLQSYAWYRNLDDRMETTVISPFLQLEGKSGITLKLQARAQYEDVLEEFSLSDDASVPRGRYWAGEGSVEFRAPRGWSLRPNATLTVGEFFDGTRVQIQSNYDWTLSKHLGLRGAWEWNRVRFDERGQAFDATLLSLTARAAIDTHLSLDIFGQYNTLTDRITTNSRLRYNFSEGRDLWLVWNEGVNLERDPFGVPRLPLSDARTLTMKYTHTMVW